MHSGAASSTSAAYVCNLNVGTLHTEAEDSDSSTEDRKLQNHATTSSVYYTITYLLVMHMKAGLEVADCH